MCFEHEAADDMCCLRDRMEICTWSVAEEEERRGIWEDQAIGYCFLVVLCVCDEEIRLPSSHSPKMFPSSSFLLSFIFILSIHHLPIHVDTGSTLSIQFILIITKVVVSFH